MSFASKKTWEKQVGKATLRLVPRGGTFEGIVILNTKIEARVTSENEEDGIRQLHDALARLSPNFIGYAGARNRFHHFFPKGFASGEYQRSERDYKLKAKRNLDEFAPLHQALTSDRLGQAVLAVFQKTNLLSPFEKAKLKDVLLGTRGNEFVRGAAIFAMGDYVQGLDKMKMAAKTEGVASWPAITYLPFL